MHAEESLAQGVRTHIYDLATAGRHRALATVIRNDGHRLHDLPAVLHDAFCYALGQRHTVTVMALARHCDADIFQKWCRAFSDGYNVMIWNKIAEAGVHPSITKAWTETAH